MYLVEQRLDIARKRASQMLKKRRRKILYGMYTWCALLAVVVLTGIVEFSENASTTIAGMAASTLILGEVSDYVVISLIAFVVGVLVTILCVWLHKKQKEDTDKSVELR